MLSLRSTPSQRSFADGTGTGTTARHNVIWTRRQPGLKVQVRQNLDQTLFEQEDAYWRVRGYHLESANIYRNFAQTRRFHGVWVQYDPYLRWQGTAWDETDETYVKRYKPLHDQVIQSMTLAGTDKEGELFRPSATLHVFEGSDLVLSRAYTYAPAIYPDTPENAPFALASVSKSITAAAVVREMAIQGLPLTSDFWPLIGVETYPSQTAVPSVEDVLRNVGGFKGLTSSYQDHIAIRDAGYGAFPISGQDLIAYIKGEGRLWTGGDDKYWDQDLLYQGASFVYSNIGYTLLGETLQTLSGADYVTYVEENLVAPIGASGSIYAAPGHRYLDESSAAAVRGYLSQEGHAYRSAPEGDAPVPPLFGSAPTPAPLIGSFQDGATVWSTNTGPVDTNAPLTASVERHSGKRHMGGAPLAAGGWVARGEALGRLVRALAHDDSVMPLGEAAKLWSFEFRSVFAGAPGWRYTLGWYVRGNWIAMAGGTNGSSTLVLHNRFYDFTVVYLTNVMGQPFGDFINPLLLSASGVWSQPATPTQPAVPQSILGGEFPCQNDHVTDYNECSVTYSAAY